MKNQSFSNNGRKITLLAILQIFILINMSFAQSGLIAESYGIQSQNIIDIEEIFEKGIGFLFWITSLNELKLVSADEVNLGCCLETSPGANCQPFPFTNDPALCVGRLIQSSCEETLECEYGCCISPEGNCATNSPRMECEAGGGSFETGPACEIQTCQDGCCILGDEYFFRNEEECNYLAVQNGVEPEFLQNIEQELECLALRNILDNGACVLEERCIQTTGDDCIHEIGGRFYAGEFCSNEELEIEGGYDYIPQSEKTCYDDDIYWEDDNGNLEDLAEDCEDSTHKCLISGGEAICKETRCSDTNFMLRYGRNPLSGESWCIYDGTIGNGTDTVGSEHWLAECVEGEINSENSYELTSPYRGYLCGEGKIEVEGSNNFFVQANPILNDASNCIAYNQNYEGEELIDKCEENSYCYFKHLSLGNGENMAFCLPSYPKGNSQEEPSSSACEMASIKIPVIYKKNNRLDDWDCISNCNVETPNFIRSMNDFCTSLGDCGTYVNYLGKGVNNFEYIGYKGYEIDDGEENYGERSDYAGCDRGSNPGDANCQRVYWIDYVNRANIDSTQTTLFPNWRGVYRLLGIVPDASIGSPTQNDIGRGLELIGSIAGGTGIIISLGGIAGIDFFATSIPGATAEAVATGTTMGTIASGAMGISLGLLAGSLIARAFGVEGDAATASSIGGGMAGGAIAFGGGGAFGTPFSSLAATFFWIGIGVIAIGIIIGGASYESRYVQFTCDPWTPPQGGENCERCNEDPMKPCTQYRCESLGTMCEFLEDNSENPKCEAMEEESNPPIISEGDILTEGYEFQNPTTNGVEVRKLDGDCLEQGQEIGIRLFTDENARCKYSTEIPASPQYEEMIGEFTEERTFWVRNHTIRYLPPRVDSLPAEDISGSIQERIGHQNLYVKCTDAQDPSNFNFNNYIVDICINEKDTIQVDFGLARFLPENEASIMHGLEEQAVKFWISEAADCKYSRNMGTGYFEMENEFSCAGLEEREIFGYPCETTITNLTTGENAIYVRCLDQPWLPANNSLRNVNLGDYKYSLFASESALNISSIIFTYDGKTISHGEAFKEGFDPIEVEMNVRTSGGANLGESMCQWKIGESSMSSMRPWSEYSTDHSQFFSYITTGVTNIYLECIDSAGNNVSAETSFSLEVDRTPPIVVRAYENNGRLKIITNENSQCYYNFQSCNLNFENATEMTTGFSQTHSASWIAGQTYYIRCEDLWENKNSGCAIKITTEH
jgi:hypothetical protein